MLSVFAFITFYLLAVVNAQNLISIGAPKASDTIISHRYVNITYTVIGSNTVNPPLTEYYPSSLGVRFLWTEKANTANKISFQVAAGYDTNPYPGGYQNIEKNQRWRAPNCHFFSRYPPNLYDFSLVFTPFYAAQDNQQVLGTQQSDIIVPLGVQVDNSSFPKC